MKNTELPSKDMGVQSKRNIQIIGFVSIVLTITWLFYILTLNPVEEYQVSLIKSLNPLLLSALIGGIIGGCLLILDSIYSERNYWYIGSILLLILYSSYYFLPYSRGYLLYGKFSSDSMFHLGMIADIQHTGHLPDLTYPATHLLGSFIVSVTAIDAELLTPLLAFLFMVLLSLFSMIYARSEISEKFALWVLFASVALFLPRFGLNPWLFGTVLLPFSLYLLNEYLNGSSRFFMLLLIFVPILTVYHPISAIFITLASILCVSYNILRIQSQIPSRYNTGYLIVLLLVILPPYWHLYHQTVDGSIRSTIISIIVGVSGSGQDLASEAVETNYTIFELIRYFVIPNWGVILLYLGLASVGAVTVVLIYLQSNGVETSQLHLLSQYIVGLGIGVAFITIDIHATSIERALRYALIFSPFMIGVFLTNIENHIRNPGKKILITLLCIVIIFAVILGIYFGYSDNHHIDQKSISGHKWDSDHINQEAPIYSSFPENDKFVFYYYGYETGYEMYNSEITERTRSTEPHIGYHEERHANDYFDSEGYIIIRTRDFIWYSYQLDWRAEELEYITKEDYEQLSKDPTVDKVYSNGGYWVWDLKDS